LLEDGDPPFFWRTESSKQLISSESLIAEIKAKLKTRIDFVDDHLVILEPEK
jgi:hypothetical protein